MRNAGLLQPMRMEIMRHKTASDGSPLRNRRPDRHPDCLGIALEKTGEGIWKSWPRHHSKKSEVPGGMLAYTVIMGQRNRKPGAWIPTAKVVVLRHAADALADVTPLLARVVEALGTNAAARVLGADRAQVSRWTAGTESIGSEMGRRIVDLHDVLTRILRVYGRAAAAMWLVGSEPLLGGARPIDILVLEGAAPVIRAIDGISEGAFA